MSEKRGKRRKEEVDRGIAEQQRDEWRGTRAESKLS